MLPDLSPAHILIVVIIALVVVGPKDLPMLLRKIGQFMGKMRGMANEFRASFDEMARQSELEELRKEVEAMRQAANAATPDLSKLGITEAMQEAEGSYMAQWQASQSEAEAYVAPETAVLGPTRPVMTGPQPTEVAPFSAPETPVADAKPAPKPRVRKPKAPATPEAETGA